MFCDLLELFSFFPVLSLFSNEKPREKGSPLRNGSPLRTLIFEAHGNKTSETYPQRAQPTNVNEWRAMRKNQKRSFAFFYYP